MQHLGTGETFTVDLQTIPGKLEGAEAPAYAGYRVTAAFQELVSADGDQPQSQLWVAGARSADVAPDGSFSLQLPDSDHMQDPWSLKVVAPSGDVALTKSYEVAQLPQELDLDVEPQPTNAVTEPDDPFAAAPKRLSGRVLDPAGERQASDLQVVLWGVPQDAADGEAHALAVARTDANGYFSAQYPRAFFSSAYGVVAGGDHVPIPLDGNGALPAQVVLAATLPAAGAEDPLAEEDPCTCHKLDPPRAPDSQDLTSSPSAYSSDLGTRCVDFTVPNRALEEFSFYSVVRTTEPQIKGLSLQPPNYVPPKIVKALVAQHETLAEEHPMMRMLATNKRDDAAAGWSAAVLEHDAPDVRIDSGLVTKLIQADPDSFTPAKLMTAERQTAFRRLNEVLKVYHRPVPGRGTLDADNAVDWDDTPTTYQATTIAHGHLLHYKQVWRADGYSLGDLLYSLPLAPMQKKQIVVLDWERRETTARTEQLEEEENLSAMISRDRDVSEILSSTLTQNVSGGSSSTVSGGGGGIGVAAFGDIDGVPFGVLAGIAGGGSSSDANAWQDSSRNVSGNTLQQLRDRTMQGASAVRSQRSTVVQTANQGETMNVETEVVHNHNHCHAITIEYFEVLRHLLVDQELADVQECLFVPLLMSFFDAAKAIRWRDALLPTLRDRTLSGGFDALDRVSRNWVGTDTPTGRYAEESPEYLDGELRISFILPRPRDKDDGSLDIDNWWFIRPLLSLDPVALWHEQLVDLNQGERDRYFRENVAPGIADKLVQNLRFAYVTSGGAQIEVRLDPTLISSYAEDVPLYVSLRPSTPPPRIAREQIVAFKIWYDGGDLPPDARVLVHSGSVRYRTKHLTHFLFSDPRILNDLVQSDSVVVTTPLDALEMRNPRHDDVALGNRLVAHLNEWIEYYHQAIWWQMDPNRRYMLLDGFVAPNSGGKSVASCVENRLIGVVGNCLVLPVARGIHLDPTYKVDPENPVDLLNLYRPTTPIPPMRISIPTRGVFAEAVMGSCNSCELKDDTRYWRFEESTATDEPAAILPVSTDSRRTAPPNLTAADFPQPMVNLQNLPTEPAPQALSSALQLLGTPNLFENITGLDLTQKNAIEAFQQALDTAKFFGSEASALAQQKKLSQDIDKTLGKIKGAQDSGLITKDQANQLTQSALKGMVGEKRPPDKSPTDVPEVKKAIEKAADKPDSSINVTTPAQSVTVNIGAPGPGPVAAAAARENVALFPQPGPRVRTDVLAALEGGLVTDSSLRPRVSAIVGAGATLRGIAEKIQPLFAGAAPPAAPAAAAAPPTVDELAQALAVYSRFYLPIASMAEFKVGLRIPLPIEIDQANGEWIVNSSLVHTWLASYDAAWDASLDADPDPLDQPDEDDLRNEVDAFFAANADATSRGVALAARILRNPFESVFFAFEVLRRTTAPDPFDVAVAVADELVNHQAHLLASLTAGNGILRLLRRIVHDDAPAAPDADLQAQIDRATQMLDAALEPAGRAVRANDVPETAAQKQEQAGPPRGVRRTVLGRAVNVGRLVAEAVGGSTFTGPANAGEIDAATFIANHLADINPGGDAQLAARIAIVQAITVNEGNMDAIRIRDFAPLSSGMQQWSMRFGSELPALLQKLKDERPAEWDLYFGQYGLDVVDDGVVNGAPTSHLVQVDPDGTTHALANFAAFRTFLGGTVVGNTFDFTSDTSTAWAGRFREASIASVRYKVAEVLMGTDRFDRILHDVPTLTIDGNAQPLQDVISSQLGVAYILDAHINSPANVGGDLQAAATAVGAQADANALDQAITNDYANRRTTVDTPGRTARIQALGLDANHGSFGGW